MPLARLSLELMDLTGVVAKVSISIAKHVKWIH